MAQLIFFLDGLINLLSRANFLWQTGGGLKFSANKQTKLQKQLAKSWQEAGKNKRKILGKASLPAAFSLQCRLMSPNCGA